MVFSGFFIVLDVGMMLDDGVLKAGDGAKDGGGLFNDAGVGNDVDDAFFLVLNGMVEGKSEGRERFSAAWGYGE